MQKSLFQPTITPQVAKLINSCKHQQKKFEIISETEYNENPEKYKNKKEQVLTIVTDDNGILKLSFW